MTCIVCTYNRTPAEPTLKNVVTEPARMDIGVAGDAVSLGNHDILVIDDASTDYTAPYLVELTHACRNSISGFIETTTRIGLARCRNLGLRRASTPLVLFGDDDCLFPPDICVNALATFSYCRDVHPTGVFLNLPVYVRSLSPRVSVPMKLIGRLDAGEKLLTTNFDCFPEEYRASPPLCDGRTALLRPFLVERMSGVCLAERAGITRCGWIPGGWVLAERLPRTLGCLTARAALGRLDLPHR